MTIETIVSYPDLRFNTEGVRLGTRL